MEIFKTWEETSYEHVVHIFCVLSINSNLTFPQDPDFSLVSWVLGEVCTTSSSRQMNKWCSANQYMLFSCHNGHVISVYLECILDFCWKVRNIYSLSWFSSWNFGVQMWLLKLTLPFFYMKEGSLKSKWAPTKGITKKTQRFWVRSLIEQSLKSTQILDNLCVGSYIICNHKCEKKH